jgi:hypothetical protein
LKRRSLHLLIVLVLVGYPILSTGTSFAVGGVKTHPTKEVFPFFTWSLFSWVPEVRNLYVVEITHMNGEAIEPPRDMREFPDFAAEATLAYKTIQELGRSGLQDSGKLVAFEGRYLKGQHVGYRVVQYSYAPLENWHRGEPASAIVIGDFVAGLPK